jgi:U3 small nucleolar RNA-associated protein 5
MTDCIFFSVINIPATSTVSALSRPIVSNPPVICATQTPVILDIENSDAESITFPAMTNPIHTLLPSSAVSIKDTNFIAADNARYITVFDPRTKGIAYNLVAEKEVASLSLSVKAESSEEEQQENSALENQVLAVIVEDGTVELFNKPFSQSAGQSGSKATSLKARAKQMTRKADAILKIVRPDTGKAVSAVQVGFQGPELFVAWAEGGVNMIFERVRWQDQDTGNLVFSGATEITGRKSASVLRSAAVIEERQASKSHVNESRAAVDSGLYAEDVEMNDAHIEDDSVSISDADEDASDVEREEKENRQTKKVNGINGSAKDAEIEENDDEEEEEAGGEPTFGELVQRNSAIDVEAELEYDAGTGALVPIASKNNKNGNKTNGSNKAVAQIPSGVSLTTVLSQALKTNDAEMLESCFRTSDVNIIRATIQRLNSSLAGTLIQRIAERMASRPGRYGHLLAWVQWTCIAHGGAIAGNSEILKRMTSLYKVMDQRSRSLPSLLLLKGKLDMLDAQINLRQSMADSRKHGLGMDDGELLDSVTHYAGLVGGSGNDDSEAERRRKRKKTSKSKRDDDEDADMDDEMAGVELGLGSESDEEEGSEEDADEDGDMIDIEAEESLDDDDDDDEEDEEEEDSDAGSDMRDFIVSEEDEDEEISDDDDDEEEQHTKAPAQPQRSSKKAKVNKSRR